MLPHNDDDFLAYGGMAKVSVDLGLVIGSPHPAHTYGRRRGVSQHRQRKSVVGGQAFHIHPDVVLDQGISPEGDCFRALDRTGGIGGNLVVRDQTVVGAVSVVYAVSPVSIYDIPYDIDVG